LIIALDELFDCSFAPNAILSPFAAVVAIVVIALAFLTQKLQNKS